MKKSVKMARLPTYVLIIGYFQICIKRRCYRLIRKYIDAPYENQHIFLLREEQHVSRFSAKSSTFGLSSARTSTFGLFAAKTSTFGISFVKSSTFGIFSTKTSTFGLFAAKTSMFGIFSAKSSTFSLLVRTPRTTPYAISFSRIKIVFP